MDYRTVGLSNCRTIELSDYSYSPQIYTILFRSFNFLTPKDLFLITLYLAFQSLTMRVPEESYYIDASYALK